DHGAWLDWLETEFDWSDQTARNFIHIFELDRDGKFKNILNLDLPLSLLYQVAAPKAEAVRTAIAERIEAGEQPSAALVTEAIAKTKPPKTRTITQDKPAAVRGEQSIVPLEERQAQMAALDVDVDHAGEHADREANGRPKACDDELIRDVVLD